MSITEWAEREIQIACEQEKEKSDNEDSSYGINCYNSALKAFKCLVSDSHSGLSMSITQSILNKLISGIPLVAIRDTEDIWNTVSHPKDGQMITKQCKRMSSLFKHVYSNGEITYHDIQRIVCFDIGSSVGYYSGFIAKIIDDMFPITMPYRPDGSQYKIYTETFLTDTKNGDFDTRGVIYVETPSGDKIDIN